EKSLHDLSVRQAAESHDQAGQARARVALLKDFGPFDQAAANGLGKLCQRRFEILHPASSQLLIPCVTLPYCAQKAQRLRRGATIANCGHAARVAASCIIFRPLPPLAKSTLG